MDALTAEHRAKQLLLRRETISSAKALMPMLRWNDLDGSFDGLARAMRPVVARNLGTSAGLSAGYLRRLRAKSGPSGRIDPIRATLDADQFAVSLRVTSVVVAKNASARGLVSDLAMRHATTLASNAMARLVLNGGRETVLATLREDPAARGYQRVLGGAGCDFCRMLADRGGVYSADTADFEAHDKCACTPEPVWA